MDYVSTRVITDDIKRLVRFYEEVTGLSPRWLTEEFAEFATPSCTLAIGSKRTMDMFGAGAARPADNHTAIIEFRVDDVDKEYEKLGTGDQRLCPAADDPAMGKPLLALSRPRREFDQFLHAGQRGGDQEIRDIAAELISTRIRRTRRSSDEALRLDFDRPRHREDGNLNISWALGAAFRHKAHPAPALPKPVGERRFPVGPCSRLGDVG